jgi:hypothetical protein
MATDFYRPDQWQAFFSMVGTGAAALTGLVFVAMSLNLDTITKDPTHRYRAIGTLSGFAAVFMRCALVLMGGQNHQAVGIELLVVSGLMAIIFVNGYVRAVRSGTSVPGPSLFRTMGGSACYVAEMAGAVVLILGSVVGLYVAAGAMVANFAVMISGAWLLVVGVSRDTTERQGRAPRKAAK